MGELNEFLENLGVAGNVLEQEGFEINGYAITVDNEDSTCSQYIGSSPENLIEQAQEDYDLQLESHRITGSLNIENTRPNFVRTIEYLGEGEFVIGTIEGFPMAHTATDRMQGEEVIETLESLGYEANWNQDTEI